MKQNPINGRRFFGADLRGLGKIVAELAVKTIPRNTQPGVLREEPFRLGAEFMMDLRTLPGGHMVDTVTKIGYVSR